ncbi:MAG: GIY-YIG nuclease family protein [Rickettsiales bacterium]|jgi:putative endonuclease|nr:GIY-YIG nuclease family protein [Rickettsiales bacterium]
MADKPMGMLYVGVTSDLLARTYKHKHEFYDGYTKKHNIKMFVYYEIFEDIENAIKREKCIKKWKRNWKFRLIIGMNPDWHDLWNEIIK